MARIDLIDVGAVGGLDIPWRDHPHRVGTVLSFEPNAAIALPQGQIAIMGPEPAVNAVYYNKIMELPESERAAWVKQKRDEYAQDVDTYKLASEMLIDDIVPGVALRDELIKRLAYAQTKAHEFPARRNGVYPV